MVVQHNMQAANANRMLNITSGAQSKSTEKLSSGYRINRAADDAAGLSISEKMRKQIRGLDKASSNAQDGVSSVQTAEGALTEVHSMLQRMNELATQAANGTNSTTDRSAIQDEMDQLTTEIDRVAETTKFNETYLLKGDNGTKTINMKAHDAGLKGTLTDNGDGTATFVMDELKVGDSVSIGGKNYTIGATADEAKTTFDDKVKKKGDKLTINGKSIEIVENYDNGQGADANAKKADLQSKGQYTLDDAKALIGEGTTIKFADGTSLKAMKGATDGIDDNDTSVITAKKAYTLAQDELLKANQIGDTNNDAKVGKDDTFVSYTLADASNTFKIHTGTSNVAEKLSFSLHVGSDADMTNKITVGIETMNSSYLGIKGLNVNDDSGIAGTYAIDAISDALQKVSDQRSSLGAVQNRLEHTIDNLDNVVENTTSAESRIRDTDMAEEMVNYSKNNILAQAGQSMLAQANQSNQGVLSLLQ